MNPKRRALRRYPEGMKFWLGLPVALIVLLVQGEARADADLSDRLAGLDASLSAKPHDSGTAALLLSRAELHRLNFNWQKSLDDLDAASRLNSELENLDLQRGLTLLRAGRTHEAILALNDHLFSHPDDGFARIHLARALADLQLYADASKAYARAIELSENPTPSLVLEMADAIQARGPEHDVDALESIEAGIAIIGPAISLELRALELEQRLGRLENALARLSRLSNGVRSRAPWLLRKGKILLLAKRTNEAGRVLEEAKILALSVPPTRRETPANIELIRSIEDLLAIARE
jgi:tetratricopeptide (TPR) repeat protein